MAHYVAVVRTSKSPEEAFAYMADLRNLSDWDPGISSSVQVKGDGPGPEAVYEVTARNGGLDMRFRYDVTGFEPGRRIDVVGRSALITAFDVIEVAEDENGTLVTYDATLKMPFPLSLGTPILHRLFQPVGDKAAAGMEKALDGTLVR